MWLYGEHGILFQSGNKEIKLTGWFWGRRELCAKGSAEMRKFMRICSLIENTSNCGMRTVHGLSLYIETRKHHVLFDVGQDETIFENARKMNIKLEDIDIVIISHGHYDHGGALGKFLEVNQTARIYIQRKAFEPHFSKRPEGLKYIGLEPGLIDHPQIFLLDGDYQIDQELSLFTVSNVKNNLSEANIVLYDENGLDQFEHEQNLEVDCDKKVLILGCGHCGITNILEKAGNYIPDVCIGGFHLSIPHLKKTVPKRQLEAVACKLSEYHDTQFYTCHCTGAGAFAYLAGRCANVHYFACGDILIL